MTTNDKISFGFCDFIATHINGSETHLADVDAIVRVLSIYQRCESPVERLLFWSLYKGLSLLPDRSYTDRFFIDRFCLHLTWKSFEAGCLLVQSTVPTKSGRQYRPDFFLCLLSSKGAAMQYIAIEVDGHDFHERTKEQARRDKRRDREMAASGFMTIRFTGSEVWNDANKCVEEVIDVVNGIDERANREFL